MLLLAVGGLLLWRSRRRLDRLDAGKAAQQYALPRDHEVKEELA
jgi:hypothetical protein